MSTNYSALHHEIKKKKMSVFRGYQKTWLWAFHCHTLLPDLSQVIQYPRPQSLQMQNEDTNDFSVYFAGK